MQRLLLALAFLSSPVLAASQDAPAQPGSSVSKAYRPGHLVRETVTLPDLEGTEHTLFPRPKDPEKRNEVEGGTVTVLVFWSLRDPLSRAYVPKVEDLAREFAERGVRVYLVASNHDEITAGVKDPVDRIRQFVADEKVTLPILLDHGNHLADRFGAVCANHSFVIGSDRIVKYAGGIDDDPQGKLERAGRDVARWLRDAVQATLEGGEIEKPNTRPSGRPLKRAPVPAPAEKSGKGEKGG